MTSLFPARAEFIAWAEKARPDWEAGKLGDAMLACEHAGWPWERIAVRAARLVANPEEAPVDLLHEAGQEALRTPQPQPANGIPGDDRAALMEHLAASAKAVRKRATGELPVLRDLPDSPDQFPYHNQNGA